MRDVDQLILSGRGGYSSRQEFFRDAIENHVLEVRHGPSEHGQLVLDAELDRVRGTARSTDKVDRSANGRSQPRIHAGTAADAQPTLPVALSVSPGVESLTRIDQTALRTPSRGVVVSVGLARFKREPLIGLHNRDYPSIWAARLLAELSQHELPPAPRFIEEATAQAWRYAGSLLELERQAGAKLTALFPTNANKPQSAEEGFRTFAIGTVARKPSADGTYETAGPLFAWQVCQLVKSEGTIHIGLTEAGWELIEALNGLTLAPPHEPEYAERFFAHLRRHAPWDWDGFEQVIAAVAESPTRTELAAHFQRWHPEWSETVANTTSAGFVARAREWGLVERKLVDGRYVLTRFGAETRKDWKSV
jgi:hypothetical protein